MKKLLVKLIKPLKFDKYFFSLKLAFCNKTCHQSLSFLFCHEIFEQQKLDVMIRFIKSSAISNCLNFLCNCSSK